MNKIILVLILSCIVGVAQAKPRGVIGSWSVNGDTLQIKFQQKTNIQGARAFSYDYTFSGTNIPNIVDGVVYLIGRTMLFNVPALEDNLFFIARLNKRMNRGRFIQIVNNNSLCDSTNFIDSTTGLDIFECIFPTSTVLTSSSGTLTKI